MSKRSVSWPCIVMVLGTIATSTAFGDIIIMATQSCRTDVTAADTNKHDSSKLSVRSDDKSAKSWIKFDISGLDVGNLETATLTVALHEAKSGDRDFDVSYVNDDCLDNIDWDERSLTWNNAPGNNTADFGGLDTSKTTLLGTVNFTDGVPGDAFTIDVLEALESDTDGIVQFVLHNSNGLLNFATHDHAEEAWRPFLTVTEGAKAKAKRPSPADGAEDVSLAPILTWRPGGFADKHDVYFGTVFDDVNNASAGSPLLVSPAQDPNTYQPGRLQFGQTYFWRIDEINAPPDSTVFKGDVWSFTTEPYAYPLPNVTATASSSFNAASGPQTTVDGSGLNALDQHDTADATMWLSADGQQPPVWIQYEFDGVYKLHQMWVWNSNNALEELLGFGVKTATIEYSTDGATWTALANVPEFAQAPGTDGYAHNTTVDFGGIAAKFVRMTFTSNWGGRGQYGLSEVRFFYIPVWARDPKPSTGAADVSPDTTLNWRAGRDAASHEVYLGADPSALTLAGTASTSSYTPTDLLLGTQYYWRIDEVNAAEAVSTWTGDVWSFSTTEFLVVDDFESYTNDSPNRVFQTWIDGLGFSPDEFFPNGHSGNGTGAAVGYDPTSGPIMEYRIVHGGRQSMPLAYSGQSETTRTFAPARDWSQHGIKTLVVHFYGTAGNTGQLYVKIGNTKIPYPGAGADIAAEVWIPWEIDLAASGSSLANVSTLSIGVDGNGAGGLLYIDDIRLK
jgi:hypothetical protein